MGIILPWMQTGSKVSGTVRQNKIQILFMPFLFHLPLLPGICKITPQSSPKHMLQKGTNQGSDTGCYKAPGKWSLVIVKVF